MSGVEADILARVGSLNLWKRHGERAPHKPLLILLALGRLQRGEPRLAPFTEIEPRLNELLQEFGTPSTRPSAQYPFWRLQGDGLWEVEAPVDLAPRRSNTDPKVSELRRDGVRGGLPESVDRTLRVDPEFASRVARTVLDEHFPTSLHPDILTKVGLDVGVAERPAESYTARSRRDPGFAPSVLRAYEYRCAVCAYDGQVGKISVGIEAAHVKWFSHGGPDVVENGLSLCSLHHKAFDLGAIAISDDHKVLVSRDFRGSGEWEARFLRVSAPLMGPQAGEPPVRAEFAAWHRKEVFREPHRHFV
jgi:putative restriction endonuclease